MEREDVTTIYFNIFKKYIKKMNRDRERQCYEEKMNVTVVKKASKECKKVEKERERERD